MGNYVAFAGALALLGLGAVSAEASPYDTAVETTPGLLAYYNMGNSTATTTTSTNGYVLDLVNGATVTAGAGPIINGTAAPALTLGGTAYATSPDASSGGLNGGISNAATIIAWINLASLPNGRTFSIAGESTYGDDVDFQIDGDNTVRFYTTGGGGVAGTTFTSNDLGQWISIAASFTANGARNIYLDGALVATDNAGGHSPADSPFYIGESPVFTGRYFDGSIADVAVYNTQLSTDQIGAIYAAASLPATVSSDVPEPAVWTMFIGGFGLVGGALRRRRESVRFA